VKYEVRPDDETIIVLSRVGALSGTAFTTSGEAVDRFRLDLREAVAGIVRSETVVSVDGRWTLANIPPGRWRLVANDSTGGIAQAQAEVGPGEKRDGVRLAFRRPQAN